MVIIAIIIMAKINYLVMLEGIMVIIVRIFVTDYFVMPLGIMVIIVQIVVIVATIQIMVICCLSLIIHFALVID